MKRTTMEVDYIVGRKNGLSFNSYRLELEYIIDRVSEGSGEYSILYSKWREGGVQKNESFIFAVCKELGASLFKSGRIFLLDF